MTDKHPTGHLIVGIVEGGSESTATPLVRKLLAGMGAKGDYAVSSAKEKDGTVVHCVFEDKRDADQLAEAVGATTISRYPGWRSQRAFALDAATRKAISEVLDVAPL
jgi:hypothetical protein